MALAVVTQDTTGHHSAGLSSLTYAFDATGSTYLLVTAEANNTGATCVISSVTYAAASLGAAIVTKNFGSANVAVVAQYGKLSPASGSNNVVITTSTSVFGIFGGAVSFSGNDPANPIKQSGSASAPSGSDPGPATVTLAGTVAGNICVDMMGMGSSLLGGSNNQTLLWQIDASGSTAGDNSGSQKANGSGSITFSWGLSANDWWGIAAVEVAADSGGAAPAPRRFIGPMRGGAGSNPIRRFRSKPLGDPVPDPEPPFETAIFPQRQGPRHGFGGPRPSNRFRSRPFVPDAVATPDVVLDEDYWWNPGAQVSAIASLYLPDASGDGAEVALDEDYYWQPPIARALATQALYLPDGNDGAASLYGQPDEDFDPRFLLGPPRPTQWENQRLPYLPDPEELPAGTLFGVLDDSWTPLVQQAVPPNWLAALYQQDEIAATTTTIVEEEYWQQRGTAPAPSSALYLPDPEEIPAASLRGQPEEDFDWRALLGPQPTPATHYLRLPYLPDPEELGTLTGTIAPIQDEDSDGRPLLPRLSQAFIFQPLPYLPDAEEIPAASLRGQLDEDFNWSLLWGAPRPAGAVVIQTLPYQPDPDEFAPSATADEAYSWKGGPSVAQHVLQLPYLPDVELLPAGSLRGQPDEDFWQCQVPHTPTTHLLRLPYLPDPEFFQPHLPDFNPDNLLDPVLLQQVLRDPILLQQVAREAISVTAASREGIRLQQVLRDSVNLTQAAREAIILKTRS